MVDRRHLVAAPLDIVATPEECAALARRFGLVSIDRLQARVALVAEGERVNATGTLAADLVQSCAITGDDLPATIREPLALLFVPESALPQGDAEVELTGDEPDEIPYSGTSFDLGEALAESLALAIDPYATGPNADAFRKEHGLDDSGPKGALAEALAALANKG